MELSSAVYSCTDNFLSVNNGHISTSEWFVGDNERGLIYHDLFVNANFSGIADLLLPSQYTYSSLILKRDICFGNAHGQSTGWDLASTCSLNYDLKSLFLDLSKQAPLVLGYCRNYHHWVFDVLPRLFVLGDQPFNGYVLTSTLLNFNGYQMEFLSILGVRFDQIISLEPNHILQGLDCLYFPNCRKDDVFGGSRGSRSKLVTRLRNYILNTHCISQAHTPTKIFISRRRAQNGTRLLDYDNIELKYREHGFEVVQLEDYSVLEQITLFHNARYIVGPHGAGLANVIFCRQDAIVVELYDNSIGDFHMVSSFERDIKAKWWGKWIHQSGIAHHILVNCSEDKDIGLSYII